VNAYTFRFCSANWAPSELTLRSTAHVAHCRPACVSGVDHLRSLEPALPVLDLSTIMLIQKTAHDVQTKHGEGVRPMRIYVISPNVPDYPHAKFPGASRSRVEMRMLNCAPPCRCCRLQVPVIHRLQGLRSGQALAKFTRSLGLLSDLPARSLVKAMSSVRLTPVLRLAYGWLSGPVACPSSFHEFEPADPIPYDVEGPSRLPLHTSHAHELMIQAPIAATSTRLTSRSRRTTRFAASASTPLHK
jgi:hypothetical protein